MLKLKEIFKIARTRNIWLCRNLSGPIMKIFIPVITFFMASIHVTRVEDCKLDEIGVKISLESSIVTLC
jgi:hypothetical protein